MSELRKSKPKGLLISKIDMEMFRVYGETIESDDLISPSFDATALFRIANPMNKNYTLFCKQKDYDDYYVWQTSPAGLTSIESIELSALGWWLRRDKENVCK